MAAIAPPEFPGEPVLENSCLPVDIVFHPSWWHRHAGIVFDPDFFYHPDRRVVDERRMEAVLYERFGDLGLGADRGRDIPLVGPVHIAAGYLLSEMLGCRLEYADDAPPRVVPAGRESLDIDVEAAFRSPAFRRFEKLVASLKTRHGRAEGDVNWAGILNLALDLRGQEIFLDLVDRPAEARAFFRGIAGVIDRFTAFLARETGTTSISVNRLVRHIRPPVFLHSECALTMISVPHYRAFLREYDAAWSLARRPFGIHYCGADPHRFAGAFAGLPHLDFLDAGWGGDLAALRRALPGTFLNIRLSPVEIAGWTVAETRAAVRERVRAAADVQRTGVCCINMDDRVADDRVRAIFEEAAELRAPGRG